VLDLAPGPVLSAWLLHGGGRSANPWLPPPGTLDVAAGTVNAELAARWSRPCLALPTDTTDRAEVAQMHNLVMTCRLADEVDEVVFCPQVTPVTVL
jgi:hypothetical protein